MSTDADIAQVAEEDLRLQPTVLWPRDMTSGQPHLVEVDLAFVTRKGETARWPRSLAVEEDCVYICALDGGAEFDHWAVHDPCVVLHRFGGSYGPAQFVVTPQKVGEHSLWLTLINQWGVPVGDFELSVSVSARPGKQEGPDGPAEGEAEGEPGPPPKKVSVPVGVADTLDELAADDEAAVDLDPVLPVGPTRQDSPGPTSPDFSYPGADDFSGSSPSLVNAGLYSGTIPPGSPDADALTEWYNVMGLRPSRSGFLHLALVRIFAPGAVPGDRTTFTARCAPGGEYGTVFAVVAEPADGEGRGRRLRSVQSARIPPGTYRITAELLPRGPDGGHGVMFHGLPAPLSADHPPWAEVMASVPVRLEAGVGPAHLIAAIEISGPDDRVVERVECVRQLITYVGDQAEDPVCYSIITYGPHTINERNTLYPEVPVTTLAWAESSDVALDVLDRLSRGPAAPVGYQGAAQLECLLDEVEHQLTGHEGRPVLVTAGGRPAHPPAADPQEPIPCTRRLDWRVPLDSLLASYPGMTFGAIHDTGRPDELWQYLGGDAGVALEEFSAPRFAEALGLTGSAVQLPLPLIDEARALSGSPVSRALALAAGAGPPACAPAR